MVLKTEISVSDILSLVGIVIASVGLYLNAATMWRSNRQKRAEFIIEIKSTMFADSEMMDIYYRMEYGKFKYNKNFHGSNDERCLDELLGLLDNIAKLWIMGNVKIDDVGLIAYEYLMIYQNPEVKKYFTYLDDWFDKRGIAMIPFDALRKLGVVLEKQYLFKKRQKKLV